MAHTYSKLQAQIAKLQAHAERLRHAEVEGVIAKIKVAIDAYGITAQDLFTRNSSKAGGKSKSPLKSTSKSKGDLTPKFADGKGNTWVGRGPRPLWLRDAMKSGKALADFAVFDGSTSTSAASVKTPQKVAGKAARKHVAAKYRDDAGNSWTGRGSQPKWLTAAIADGKRLDQFAL